VGDLKRDPERGFTGTNHLVLRGAISRPILVAKLQSHRENALHSTFVERTRLEEFPASRTGGASCLETDRIQRQKVEILDLLSSGPYTVDADC